MGRRRVGRLRRSALGEADGRVLFGKVDPPQDEILVANATGNVAFDTTIVGALRGAGWNVRTFVDETRRTTSVVIGASPAAAMLSKDVCHRRPSGSEDDVFIGTDLAPETE